jgi:short subunit dehydrogenase-like uncharacterized protein
VATPTDLPPDAETSMANYLIYGANGYTGALIAREAVARGQRPLLAGRNVTSLATLAGELGLKYRAFSLDDPAAIDAGIKDMTLVLHCAGPFSHTAKAMADACLRMKTHYLDVTGEVAVFESLAARDQEAKDAGIALMPGVGFDVVPSDCLAAHLKQRLPSATQLTLGFLSLSRLSRGTAKTMAENFHRGGLIRRDGVLTPVPAAWKTRMIDFGTGPVLAMTIPWGDVSTAYYSTRIPNIEVYMGAPRVMRLAARASRYFRRLLGSPFVQLLIKKRIDALPPGPTDDQRARSQSYLWGEAIDGAGKTVVSRIRGPEGYTLTVLTALAVVERVLSGRFSTGFQTPSMAYGPGFILGVPDVAREDEKSKHSALTGAGNMMPAGCTQGSNSPTPE